MASEISCPVSNIIINENRVRVVAFQVFLLSVAYFLVPTWVIPAFLLVDFFLRAFKFGKYSPASLLSAWITSLLNIKNKPIDQAPKIFAAQLGFAIVCILFIINLSGNLTLSYYVDGILVIFSFLESVLGICAGCYVYTFLQKFSKKP